MSHHHRVLLLSAAAALAGLALTACGGSAPAERAEVAPAPRQSQPTVTTSAQPTAPARDGGKPVYVAVGASETVGVGADQPVRQAWPRVLHDAVLRGSTYVNVGVSGSTAGEALTAQLPRALEAQPDVVTVWLAVNDITHLVPVEAYEQQLRTLVHALRQGGRTQVLVGNVPAVQDLPAYRACLPGAPQGDVTCSLPIVPPESQVVATVDRFNAAIDRVAAAEGAEVVDLSARRNLTRLTSDDGFHPSTRGHRLIARSFARALEG